MILHAYAIIIKSDFDDVKEIVGIDEGK